LNTLRLGLTRCIGSMWRAMSSAVPLGRMVLPLVLALPVGWGHAQTVAQASQILNQELRFKPFDKVELGDRERCPDWLGAGRDAVCRVLHVLYRDVYLSGFLMTRELASERLVIYHGGHEIPVSTQGLAQTDSALLGEDAALLVSRLYADDADVLVLFMPGNGFAPRDESPSVERIFKIVGNHSAFALLDGPGDSSASYFIAHVRGFLDRFAAPYRSITMVGRSGGGYSTTLAAAHDKRISCSVSFFGTLPMTLRLPVEGDGRDDLGDFEQHGLWLFRKLDYIDLYALATQPKRTHVQVYNEVDDCCFSGQVKGRRVAGMFERQYPAVRGFDVAILPRRSDADHNNLDDFALALVREKCPASQGTSRSIVDR
jgi:pimeloyl-ACP methyl ester carboxylesterase